jgi:hypothetical protein
MLGEKMTQADVTAVAVLVGIRFDMADLARFDVMEIAIDLKLARDFTNLGEIVGSHVLKRRRR